MRICVVTYSGVALKQFSFSMLKKVAIYSVLPEAVFLWPPCGDAVPLAFFCVLPGRSFLSIEIPANELRRTSSKRRCVLAAQMRPLQARLSSGGGSSDA
jgi:hypothetical protein